MLAAPGSSVRFETPLAVSSIFVDSSSIVVASWSTESSTCWPESVGGFPSPFRVSTSVCVESLTSLAAERRLSSERFEAS